MEFCWFKLDPLPPCMFHDSGKEPPHVGRFFSLRAILYKHGMYNHLIYFVWLRFPKEEPLAITCQPSPALLQPSIHLKHQSVFLPWFPSIRLRHSLCRGPDGPRSHIQDRYTLGQSYSKPEISEGECCSVEPLSNMKISTASR